jgi:hypothetical protein
LIAAIIIAAALLIAIVIGMGTVTFSSPGNLSSVTVAPALAPSATGGPAPTAPPARGAVKGAVTVSVTHLKGSTYRFTYTVHDTGKTPIAGFQINGPQANLFHLVNSGWGVFGSGVCGGKHPDLLVYWSTSDAATNQIKPGKTRTFGFDVNTSGQIAGTYAVSYGTAAAQFGQTKRPAGSTLPTTGPCQ